MAKLNIEVTIDWLGEDGNLDTAIKDEIKNHIINTIQSQIIDEIKDSAAEIAKNRIGLWINEFISKQLQTAKVPVSKGGYFSGETKEATISEILDEQIKAALTVQVDEDGKPTDYRSKGTRLEFITGKIAREMVDEKVKDFGKGVKSDVINYLSGKVKDEVIKQFTGSMIQNVDFNQLFKS